MKMRDYQLPDQFERMPISGAIVFQRWHDDKQNRDLQGITTEVAPRFPPRRINRSGRVL